MVDERHKHFANSRAVLRKKDWKKWINPAESSDKQEKPRRNRKYDVEADAKLRNSIKMVLATARTEWPDAKTRPAIDVMAKELERLDRKDLGYKFEAIRKILRGTYKPSVRHGIPGL